MTQTDEDKYVEYQNDFHELSDIYICLVKSEIIEKRSSKNSMPDGMSRWLRRFRSSRTKGEYARKWIQKRTGDLCRIRAAIGGMCHQRIRVCRENYILFFIGVSSHLLFLWFPSPSLSFDLPLVRKDPDTCFHSKHSEEASPCNNMTVNTKDTRPIFSFDSYGVVFLSHSPLT